MNIGMESYSYVLGNAITEETLMGMPGYEGKVITRKDLAQAALSMKDVEVIRKFQPVARPFTTVWIYNATGSDLMKCGGKNWSGMIQWVPPPTIRNGQSVGFVHGPFDFNPTSQEWDYDESSGAAVYRGQNENGEICDWMTAWYSRLHKEKAEPGLGELAYLVVKTYGEVGEQGHFTNDAWEDIYHKLTNASQEYEYRWNGCLATAKIEVRVEYEHVDVVERPYGLLDATFTLDN